MLGEPLPTTNGERASLLLKNKIGLWDTLAQCDIIGASDSSVKNAIPRVTVIMRTTVYRGRYCPYSSLKYSLIRKD